jgi:hypothetical protein
MAEASQLFEPPELIDLKHKGGIGGIENVLWRHIEARIDVGDDGTTIPKPCRQSVKLRTNEEQSPFHSIPPNQSLHLSELEG